MALERAERFEAERGGRQRAEQVQALAEELAVAERPEQVLAALTGRARLLLGRRRRAGGRGRSIPAGPAAGLARPTAPAGGSGADGRGRRRHRRGRHARGVAGRAAGGAAVGHRHRCRLAARHRWAEQRGAPLRLLAATRSACGGGGGGDPGRGGGAVRPGAGADRAQRVRARGGGDPPTRHAPVADRRDRPRRGRRLPAGERADGGRRRLVRRAAPRRRPPRADRR